MLTQTSNSWLRRALDNNRVAEKVKSLLIDDFIEKSVGDWRYPLHSISWKIAELLVPRRHVHINDVSFTLSCTNWVTHFRWFLFEKKEPEVIYYINTFLNTDDVFFDIGANVGVFSIYAAKRYPDLSLYCFEPEYSNLNELKENILLNGLKDCTTIFSVGISSFVGLSKLHLQDTTAGSAAHTESKTPIEKTDEGYPVVWSEGIVSVTLDYICEQLGVYPNAMKIDTDGNEDKILRGAFKTLRNRKCRSMIIEMPSSPEKRTYCIEALTGSGFQVGWADPDKTRNEIWIRKS